MKHYILKGREIIEVDTLEWARWFEENREARVLGKTKIDDERTVSTVFLGLEGEIFETMVLGSEHELMRRCDSWDEAVIQHRVYVNVLRKYVTE